MLRSFTPLRGILLVLGLVAAQACSQRPDDQPAPTGSPAGAGLSIAEARAWYQATYAGSSAVATPGPSLPATATATGATSDSAPAALVWERALTVGSGSQQLVLVPLAGDHALFAQRPYAGSRYLIVARTTLNALDGSLVEVLLRRTPAPLDTLALFTNLYRSYRSGHLAAPGTGEGHVFLYSADYRYQAGHQFRHGQFVGNSARLGFQAVPGTGTTPATGKGNGGVAKTNNVPPIDACIDWYDANTGDFIVRTGHCDDFGGGAGDVPHVYTGGGGPGGSYPGPGGYGGHGPSSGSSGPPTNSAPPCRTMQALGAGTGFVGLMTDLKTKTGLNHEEGYTYTLTGTAVTNAVAYQGAAGSGYIDLNHIQAPIDGYMHSHYTGLLSVFSGSDLRAIYELYKGNHIRDTRTFTAQVITASGTTYSMTITDPAALVTFGDRWFVDGPYWNTFEGFFYDGQYNIKTTNSATQNELGFLNMLAGSNMGLTLLKGDNNTFNTWQQLSLDANGAAKAVPCQ